MLFPFGVRETEYRLVLREAHVVDLRKVPSVDLHKEVIDSKKGVIDPRNCG